ncbi:MAG: Mrp/NBP35 family ATP-binding protein [Candidatus Acidiferrales bacterium]
MIVSAIAPARGVTLADNPQQSRLTEAVVYDALRTAEDPEHHRSILSLNLVRSLVVRDGAISLVVSPLRPEEAYRQALERNIRAAIARLPGVQSFDLKFDAATPGGRRLPDKEPIAGVKHLVAVASGKGGVGKTTVAVNLSIALQRIGAKVGLLDADVYGPNVPLMLGTTEQPRALAENVIVPVEAYGLKIISMGLLNPGDRPLIWRGPMLHGVVQQFLRSVQWGELDYLIIDLPPGTGDVQLSLVQSVAVSGVVIVTTPSIVALADVRKAIEMFRQVNVGILGIVENMSYFSCPHCDGRIDVFGHGEGASMARTFGVPLLGEIEIDPQIRIGGDTGKPVAAQGEDAPGAKSIFAVARAVEARLAESGRAAAAPNVQIL